MSRNCKTVLANSLSEVAKIRDQFPDSLANKAEGDSQNGEIPEVEFPEVEIPSPEEVTEEIKKISSEKKKIQELVETRLPQVLRWEESRDPTYRERYRQQAATLKKNLKALLSHSFPDYRQVAIATYLKVFLSQPCASKKALAESLSRLCAEGLLVEDEKGTLKINQKAYRPAVDLGEEELGKIVKVLESAMSTAKKTAEARAQEMIEDWKHIPDLISWEELLDYKPGKFFIGVPPEQEFDRQGRPVFWPDGTPKWRGGGHLLVESDGQGIRPLGAASPNLGFVASIEEVKKLKVGGRPLYLSVDALREDDAPYVPGLAAEKGAKVRLLWHLIMRGRKAQVLQEKLETERQAEEEQIEAERSAMARQADLNAKEFFLDNEEGDHLADFQGIWEMPEGERVRNLFFLIRRIRIREDGTTTLQVLKTPRHLGDLLSGCLDEHPESEKFGKSPQPLKAILQAIFGQVYKNWSKE